MHTSFRNWTTVAAALLLAFTVAGSFGAWHWLLDLASHFRAYWLLAAVLGAVLGSRRPASVAFVCCLLALVGNAWALCPSWVLAPSALPAAVAAAPDAAPALELVTANLHRFNPDKSRAVAYLRDRRPDVAVLLEVNADWVEALAPLDELYPSRLVEPREDGFGIAVLSRWPLSEERRIGPVGTAQLQAAVTVAHRGREVRLFATHPISPLTTARWSAAVEQLGALADVVALERGPRVVAGDFNATPWSLAYRVFASRSGLRDTALGRGVQPTWNVRLPAPRIPIDHVFASPEIAVLDRRVGPDIGSDHLPVEVTLVLPPAE